MADMQIGKATLLNIDCMEYMKTLKDNEFDLAIVDPPYGINADKKIMGKIVIAMRKLHWLVLTLITLQVGTIKYQQIFILNN